jgi:hypothetical protein
MAISSTEEPQTGQTLTHWTEKYGSEHPIFQIIEPDRHIKIYANGFVEGCAPGSEITNRIFSSIRPELLEVFSKSPNGTSLSLFIGDIDTHFGASQEVGLYSASKSEQSAYATGEK